jgi:hypothetical protein
MAYSAKYKPTKDRNRAGMDHFLRGRATNIAAPATTKANTYASTGAAIH